MISAGFLSVRNWDKFQQYKDDRPMIFIRLDVGFLDDYDVDGLTEIQQLHLLKIYLLAGRCGNKIINDPKWIGRKINAKSKVNIKQLVTDGFLVIDGAVQDRTDSYGASESLGLEEKRREKIRIEENRRCNFEKWYAEYPRKASVGAAEKAWMKHDSLPDIDYLLAALVEQKKLGQFLNGDKKFMPHPATYINNARWKDAPLEVHRGNSSAPDVQSQSFKKWDGKESEVIGPTHDQYGDMK